MFIVYFEYQYVGTVASAMITIMIVNNTHGKYLVSRSNDSVSDRVSLKTKTKLISHFITFSIEDFLP